MDTAKRFAESLQNLNKEQLDAVESIYGPIMVVAGPGTGKTQIISLRTANIISKTGADPRNILITTFTEAGVIALKKRLFEFIGTESYRVNVSTIHSFCNDIIQTFPEKFLEYRALRSVDDIEALEIYESILDEGGFEALASDYDRYFYVKTIRDRISKLKQEGVSPEMFSDIIAKQRAEYDEKLSAIDPKLKKYATEGEKYEKHIKKLTELLRIYRKYLEVCRKRGIYDFADMIDFVLKRLREDENLRLHYGETYQFIMVDEYQDTNNAQNSIIDLILSVSEDKNIMVVGDDDQSIYRFQGANLENMLHFSKKYEETRFVVLKENYRSTQEILDLASESIGNNRSRITNYIEGLDKQLHSNSDSHLDPEVRMYLNDPEEKASVIARIRALASQGIRQEEIAVIVRTNREVESWTHLLKLNGFEVTSRLDSNILDSRAVRLLLDILTVAQDPFASDTRIADLLRSSIWPIDRVDALRILRKLSSINYTLRYKIRLMDFLTDDRRLHEFFVKLSRSESRQDGVESPQLTFLTSDIAIDDHEKKREETVSENDGPAREVGSDAQDDDGSVSDHERRLSRSLDGIKDFVRFIAQSQEKKTLRFYEYFKFVVEETGFLDFIDQDHDFESLQDVYTLFESAKDWSQSDPDMNLDKFLKKIGYYRKYEIQMPRNIIGSSVSGINVLTAHQSKGLEYDAVIVPGLFHGNWGGRRVSDLLKLPFGVIGSDLTESLSESESDEEERRLFFVAVTRARKHLTLSYSSGDQKKPRLQSRFISELPMKAQVGEPADIRDVILNEMRSEAEIAVLQRSEERYIREFLKTYRISPSDLNKFIEDPRLFLRDTIFKYPFEDNEFTIFGKAYHKTLEYFYLEFKKRLDPNDPGSSDFKDPVPSLEYIKQKFTDLLEKEPLTPEEAERLLSKGLEGLAGWYALNAGNMKIPVELEYDFRPRKISLGDVPITGKIDKIEQVNENEVRLVDYKTGREKSANEILGNTAKADRKYYRQLLFYKIMFDLDPSLHLKYDVSELSIEFVEGKNGKYPTVSVPFTEEDLDSVKGEIRKMWTDINDISFWRDLLQENARKS